MGLGVSRLPILVSDCYRHLQHVGALCHVLSLSVGETEDERTKSNVLT